MNDIVFQFFINLHILQIDLNEIDHLIRYQFDFRINKDILDIDDIIFREYKTKIKPNLNKAVFGGNLLFNALS